MKEHEWKKAEEMLKAGKSVVLIADGYKVELRPVRYNGFSFAVLPFINGEYNSQWLISNCEERRRFFNTIKIKAEGNREMTEYRAVWTSQELMKIHFEKENKSIELKAEEHYKVPLKKFYFTFGSSDAYPYRGGWVEVYAVDISHAIMQFRNEYPDRNGLLNCADYYTENRFKMNDKGNLGAYCHRVIIPEGAEADE